MILRFGSISEIVKGLNGDAEQRLVKVEESRVIGNQCDCYVKDGDAISSCCSEFAYKENTSFHYGSSIVYKHYGEIDFGKVAKDKMNIPLDLLRYLSVTNLDLPQCFLPMGNYRRNALEDNVKQMRGSVFEGARDLGFSKADIFNLPAQEAVALMIEIVAKRLDYHEVDDDQRFIKEFGAYLPTWKYWELKLGDCDKYSSSLTVVFNIFKMNNPNLGNIYITNRTNREIDVGIVGLDGKIHRWNEFIIMGNNSIVISDIDPTFYDYDLDADDLEAKYGYHISENKLFMQLLFYASINDPVKSYYLAMDLYNRANNIDVVDRRGLLLLSANYLYIVSGEYPEWSRENIEIVLDNYLRDYEEAGITLEELMLGVEVMLSDNLGIDVDIIERNADYYYILFYAISIFKRNNELERVEMLKEEMRIMYPARYCRQYNDCK